MSDETQSIKSQLDEILSAIRGKHSLLGIAVLLLLQYSCIHGDVKRVETATTQACTETLAK